MNRVQMLMNPVQMFTRAFTCSEKEDIVYYVYWALRTGILLVEA
jgi:hypothetical protein